MRRPELAATKAAFVYTHGRIPYLRKLPANVFGVILIVAIVNICVWVGVGILLTYHRLDTSFTKSNSLIPKHDLRELGRLTWLFHPAYRKLSGTAVLAYSLGLRHALDADHIAAIDLTTRRLVAAGQRPATVGTFFSLGHSTIVIITSIAVAATSNAVSKHFDQYSKVGGIIGSSVSAAFLILLATMNIYIFYRLVKKMKRMIDMPADQKRDEEQDRNVYEVEHNGGPIFSILRKLFKLIDRPWKIYPLGVLFGLGFDTSSEVALLAISSIQGAQGTSLWIVLIYPLLFTAGMCLIDTIDGALMLVAYTSATFAREPLAAMYYSACLTAVTCIVAIVIGVLQTLTLAVNVADPPEGSSKFWDGVRAAGDRYDVIGGAIVGCFVLAGVLSLVFYKRWRKWVDQRRERKNIIAPDSGDGEVQVAGEHVQPVVDDNITTIHDAGVGAEATRKT